MRLHQTKIFCIAKETSTKRTGGLLNEKIFVNDTSSKGLNTQNIQRTHTTLSKNKQHDF